jgi:serine phosphatase RsbU (regulator of sigma subunit)
VSGVLQWLNAGHPQPLLFRDGHVEDVPCDPNLPLGLGDSPPMVAVAHLEPGDAVLFFTDGVTDAESPTGEAFGRDRLAALFAESVRRATPAEVNRLISHAILRHADQRLRDDATQLLVVWRGPNGSA